LLVRRPKLRFARVRSGASENEHEVVVPATVGQASLDNPLKDTRSNAVVCYLDIGRELHESNERVYL